MNKHIQNMAASFGLIALTAISYASIYCLGKDQELCQADRAVVEQLCGNKNTCSDYFGLRLEKKRVDKDKFTLEAVVELADGSVKRYRLSN